MPVGGSLELFSGFKALIELLEELFGILDLKNKDSPETLQESLLQNELIAKVLQAVVKQLNHGLLGFFEMSIKSLAQIVLLNLKL